MKHLFTTLARIGDPIALAGLWFSAWLYRALLVALAGGIMGLLIAPVTKVLFFKTSAWAVVLKGGFVTGCEYAGLWATAVALVWVVMDRSRISGAVSVYLMGRKHCCTAEVVKETEVSIK